MRFDLLTLFPAMCETVLGESILGRAQKAGLLDIHCHQIRDYTLNRQKQVDDYPYGGGQGMVMNAQPIADCFRAVCSQIGRRPHFIYMSSSAQGSSRSCRKSAFSAAITRGWTNVCWKRSLTSRFPWAILC